MNTFPLRVLVVDDSTFMRHLICELLGMDSDISVVGVASDGEEAVHLTRRLRPDLVIMDVNMPKMNGLQAIAWLMTHQPTAILVLTEMERAKLAMRAIQLGAMDVMSKSELDLDRAEAFLEKVKILGRGQVIAPVQHQGVPNLSFPPPIIKGASEHVGRMVGIAASTGGPQTLARLLSGLPREFPYPIVVAQHISEEFVDDFSAWLQTTTSLIVKVGKDEPIVPGTVYISPAHRNLLVGSEKFLTLDSTMMNTLFRPDCDAILASMARVFGWRSIGIILTGMGCNGVKGMEQIHKIGGYTMAQDHASSIVFGMPGEAITQQVVDVVASPEEICGILCNLTRTTRVNQPLL
ncbi:MAG: response regulator [Nitrospirae bacterium]|nr:response regulator [Magnetococcales bacterium]